MAAITMEKTETMPSGAAGCEPRVRSSRWWSLDEASLPRLRNARTRRVLLVLVLIWIVAVFDLAFTLLALRIGGFYEANPLARQFIHSPGLLATFKFATLAAATGIFLAFSRYRVAELACWLIGAVYVGLALLWLAYYV